MSRVAPPYPKGHELLAGKTLVVTAAAGTGIGFWAARRCLEEPRELVELVVRRSRSGKWSYPQPAGIVGPRIEASDNEIEDCVFDRRPNRDYHHR